MEAAVKSYEQRDNPRGKTYFISGWQNGIRLKNLKVTGSTFYARDWALKLLRDDDIDQVQVNDEKSQLLLDLTKTVYPTFL